MITKDQPVDEIPLNRTKLSEGWILVKLGDIAYEVSDRVENPSESQLERFVGLEHLESGSFIIRQWGNTADVTSAMKLFRRGDTLFARRNAYLKRASMATFDGVCSGDAIVLREKQEMIVKGFLPLILNTEELWHYAIANAAGSMSKRVKWHNLSAYEFALPPKDEQQRIADILWAADEAIENYNVAANAIQTARDAIRKEKFANTKLPVRLADLCEQKGIQIGPFGSQLHASDYVDNGIPVIMPSDMSNGEVNETSIARITPEMAEHLSLHKVLPGDILLPRRGELDKRAFIFAHQAGWVCGTGSIRIRIGRPVLARAVFHALAAPQTVRWIQDHAVGTTMPNLNAQIVSNIPISLPEGQELEHLVQILERLNSNSSSVLENIKKLNSLKKTLLDTVLEQKR